MKKSIYLISGLGADERVFEHLNLDNYEPKFVQWIAPTSEETIKEYATRLSQQIETPKPIILGVSFGGMIAIEIAKQIDCEQVILISSAKTKNDIPILYQLLGKTKLHKLVPITVLKCANMLTYWFFGMETTTEKKLLKSILTDTDRTFLRWAINAIVKWDNQDINNKIIHIHGQKDRILPISNIRHTDFTVQDGGHLMIYNRANNINKILNDILKIQ